MNKIKSNTLPTLCRRTVKTQKKRVSIRTTMTTMTICCPNTKVQGRILWGKVKNQSSVKIKSLLPSKAIRGVLLEVAQKKELLWLQLQKSPTPKASNWFISIRTKEEDSKATSYHQLRQCVLQSNPLRLRKLWSNLNLGSKKKIQYRLR